MIEEASLAIFVAVIYCVSTRPSDQTESDIPITSEL